MGDVRVKICGICSPEDAHAARELGANYLGMILSQGFDRSLLPDQAVEIGLTVDAPLVAVFVDEPVDEVQRIAELIGISVIQLHGAESSDYVQELHNRGGWEIWKSVRVRESGDVIETLNKFGDYVDGVLLDAWHPDSPGGSGASFAWEEVSSVRDIFPPNVRLIVAGGLAPDNVEQAARILSPDVVDVSSGVELSPRIKDHALILEFVRNVQIIETPVIDIGHR